jgi:hypothetical protein
MTLVVVHEDLVNDVTVWPEYLKNVDDYDKRLTDGWKDDANGVLVFVSHRLLVPVSITDDLGARPVFSPRLSHPSSSKATNAYHSTLVASLRFSSDKYPTSLLALQMAPMSNRNRIIHPLPAPPLYA